MKLFKARAQEKKAPPKRARGFGGNKMGPFPASSTIPSLAFGSRGNGLGLFPVIASSGAPLETGRNDRGRPRGSPKSRRLGLSISSRRRKPDDEDRFRPGGSRSG